jgi:type II restriction/modification system DNA methylase subunit YeeA
VLISLLKLQQRLGQLKIFDPACGSGNFLIIAYKELRKFEMELLKRIQELELEKTGQFSKPFSVIQVSQFYGIEVDDFAHEIAILSLWLVEHQMNLVFKDEFGESLLSLPLKHSGNIIAGNALRIDWNSIFSNSKLDQEIFILGNPPYLGFAQQTVAQKEEIKLVWGEPKKLDYISCWFLKASQLITAYKGDIEVGFVSTNSITQGEQVSVLWPSVLVDGVNISFCHTSFQWRNSARSNAGVYCVIIGLSKKNKEKKLIYSESTKNYAEHITPYLTSGKTNYILKRRKPLSQLPEMKLGEMAKDGEICF